MKLCRCMNRILLNYHIQRKTRNKNAHVDLLRVFDRICTATPSSASIERVHCLYTNLMTKLRGSLGDMTVVQLVFLKVFIFNVGQ